jgi:outer membrane receptor protein involved in Fe transport
LRALLLATAALVATGTQAQETPIAETDMPAEDAVIIVTATKRAQALTDVPIAVTAIGGDQLLRSGATDIRQLNQLSPSLLVSSTSSEAGAGVARIRGIGTVGDNPGLESSVAVFIDGVYRNRSGVGLTELGAVERIEVLRGPQGTLFGRNASAGLINVVTRSPGFDTEGEFEISYGNFNQWRLGGGFNGVLVEDRLAARFDGIWTKRDGFATDVISGRDVNNRDRYLLRGQLLFTPTEDLRVRLIGDYANRDEECCASAYLPFRTSTRDADGNLVFRPTNPVVDTIRSLGGIITDDTYARQTSITPGRSYNSDVEDWGLSGEIEWDAGFGTFTSITAWRDWDNNQAQDADFTNLDILARDNQRRRFQTFSQELRLQGEIGRLDWLVGGYFAREQLDLVDDLRYGADYQRYADALVRLSVPSFPGYATIAALVGRPGDTLNGRGIVRDEYNQVSRNWALFTHNVWNVTDRLALTLGLRYTNERKTLDVSLDSDNSLCAAIASSPAFAALATLPCVINPVDFTGSSVRNEDEVTGTLVLSYKPSDALLTYASYSRGYKAGGFNLDRSPLVPGAVDLDQLQFEPELVNSYEIGAKWNVRNVRISVAGFWSQFDQFQLNTFQGVNFIVENIQSCRQDLNGGDRDFAGLPVNGRPLTQAEAAATGACPSDAVTHGVVSRGVEAEATLSPAADLTVNLGVTYADTRYKENLTGLNGRPLATPLFLLPGSRLSNAPELVQTGAIAFTPEIQGTPLRGLFYLDYRFQSEMNTGSDLFPEKRQRDFFVMNARVGISGPDDRWSLELWAQNLLNEEFQQVAFNTPLQGSGTFAQTARGGPNATTLFGSFLGEPRTFGFTLRTRF